MLNVWQLVIKTHHPKCLSGPKLKIRQVSSISQSRLSLIRFKTWNGFRLLLHGGTLVATLCYFVCIPVYVLRTSHPLRQQLYSTSMSIVSLSLCSLPQGYVLQMNNFIYSLKLYFKVTRNLLFSRHPPKLNLVLQYWVGNFKCGGLYYNNHCNKPPPLIINYNTLIWCLMDFHALYLVPAWFQFIGAIL